MKLRTLNVVMFALLLVAMAMVPMASAVSQGENLAINNQKDLVAQQEERINENIALGSLSQDTIEKNYVSLDIARNQAKEELEENIHLKKFGDGVNWTGSNLNQNPSVVYDIDGKMLFYKFWVQSEGKIIGEINIASSKALGSPIQSVSTTSTAGLDIEKMQSRAKEIISSSFPGYEKISERIVLYDFPLTGLQYELMNKNTKDTITFVVDPNSYPDYRIINSTSVTCSKSSSKYTNNSRSVYDSMPQNKKTSNLEIWQKETDRINTINEKINSINSGNISLSEGRDESIKSAFMTGKATSGTRILLRNGNFPTAFQGYGYDWCKVGTAQVITTYYYVIGRPMDNGQTLPRTRTLQEIATKMGAQGTSAPPNSYMEQYYYQNSWSDSGLGMGQFLYQPFAPTLSYITGQINNGDPFKIGTQRDISTPFGTVPAGHARACYGYDTTGSQPIIYLSDTRLGTQGQLTYEVFVSSNYNTYIGKTTA